MNTVMLYAAGPIDDVSTEEAQGWRAGLMEIVPTGVLVFNPATAWLNVGQATAQAVDYGNRVVICASDGVLVNMMGPGRAFGTIREIEFARTRDIPVAVATGDNEIVSLLAHDLIVKTTIEEALDELMMAINTKREASGIPPFMRMLLGGQEPG